MLTVVTFKWAKPGYRSTFTAENVNVTRRMVARHYPEPHQFVCVTDDPTGIDPEIKTIPLWDDYSTLANPSWAGGPSCYRRLKVFSEWFESQHEGDRLVVVDLDVVFTADLRPLWNRDEPFLIWRPNYARIPVCASMFMVRRGAHREIWDTFDHMLSPKLAGNAGFKGSDQAWIAYCVGRDTPGWTTADGVYGYKDHILKDPKPVRNISVPPRLLAQARVRAAQRTAASDVPTADGVIYGALPKNARVVMFTGKPDPWDKAALTVSPWIREHYR